MTIFAASGNSRTFDYQAGDIAYISPSVGHFIESTGNTTLKFLEIFKSPVYEDVSLSQWLALTPKQIVQVSRRLAAKLLICVIDVADLVMYRFP